MEPELKKLIVAALWKESEFVGEEEAQDFKFLATSVKNNMPVFALMLKLRQNRQHEPRMCILDAIECTYKHDEKRAMFLLRKWKELRKHEV